MGVIVLYQFAGHFTGPVSGVELFTQFIDCRRVVIPAYTSCIRVLSGSLYLKPLAVVTGKVFIFYAAAFVQQCALETMLHPLRVPVHLSYSEGVVTGIVQHLRHFIIIVWRYFSVSQQAVMPRGESGKQSGTGRSAAGARGIAVHKEGSFACQFVQVGGDYCFISHAAHGVATLLVGHD